MELSFEAYRTIVKNVGSRADIATLCRVSRGFRHVSEPALYNTIFMQNDDGTIRLCNTLASSPRLASFVDALTILLSGYEENNDSGDSGHRDAKVTRLPGDYWTFIAKAMEKVVRLRYLNVHINNGSTTSNAWILDSCTFNLQSFHCDFDWDEPLVRFLDRQTNLKDLCILDYKNIGNTTTLQCTEELKLPRPPLLDDNCIPKLAILECTCSEAAIAIVPNRPITHLKTCFSHLQMGDKQREISQLLTKVRLSTRPLISLDISDSSYTEEFSRELLLAIGNAKSILAELRYLGTLVLPVDGRERLQFYGLLMRFPKIQCLELDISGWKPPPSSPAALRALASELRLYNPSIIQVIFVQECDSSVVRAVNGICRLDTEVNTDILWRENWNECH